jgi:hypothetical protein
MRWEISMKVLATIAGWAAHLWVGIAAGIILVSCAGTLVQAESLGAGVGKLWEVWNPFNPWNVFACFLLIAPAIGLHAVSDRLRERA